MPTELLAGLQRFRDTDLDHHRDRYRQLAEHGQQPRVLFVTCSDSRIVPHLFTGTGPGDLFVVRTVANIVLPPDAGGADPTMAAVEFAVGVLGVQDIVVCGHTLCGGMQALYDPPDAGESPNLAAWVRHAQEARLPDETADAVDDAERDRRTGQRNVGLSLRRLAARPIVAERRAQEELTLHGWYYDIATQDVAVLDPASGEFRPPDHIGAREA